MAAVLFYDFGPFRLDAVKRRLLKDGAPVPLRPKTFELLLALVQRSGEDVDKEQLTKLLWPDTIVEENSLAHAVSKLRKALNEHLDDHRYIVTLPGRGYRFVAAVRTVCMGDNSDSVAGTVDSRAHTAYQKGRYHWNRRTPERLKRAIQYFEAAIERDPNYGPAYAGLADCYVLGGTGSLSRRETMARAKAAATRALALDDDLPEAHASLASVAFRWEWNWSEAERSFRRAIQLSPRTASIRHGYALFLCAMGRFPEAIAEMRRACELDPVSLVVNAGLGRVLDFARRHGEAIEQYRDTLEIDSSFAEAYFDLAMAYDHAGDRDEALAAARLAAVFAPDSIVYAHHVACLRARAGNRTDAACFLAELDARSADSYISPVLRSYLLLALGRHDEAFLALETACDERAAEMIYFYVDPDWDSVRMDPRFQSLLRRIGFPL